MKGKSHSAEARAKISAARKGKPLSEERRVALIAANKESWADPGKRARRLKAMRAGQARSWADPGKRAHRLEAMRAGWARRKAEGKKRKPFSAEHRAKLSAAEKGRPSPKKGKPATQEQRAAMKAGWARRKARLQAHSLSIPEPNQRRVVKKGRHRDSQEHPSR
jgi:hypothetical protein